MDGLLEFNCAAMSTATNLPLGEHSDNVAPEEPFTRSVVNLPVAENEVTAGGVLRDAKHPADAKQRRTRNFALIGPFQIPIFRVRIMPPVVIVRGPTPTIANGHGGHALGSHDHRAGGK